MGLDEMGINLTHTHQERERERNDDSSLVIFVTVFFKQFVGTQKFLWATVYTEEVVSVVTNVAMVSLIPRPHPLMRRNSLVNQVKFLGLAHAFATM